MKKVLILGAGIYQVPLIQTVKKMGYQTLVASIQGNYPGFKFADKIYYINTLDKFQILEMAQKEKIDAILTTGTDVAVSTIGYVCDHLDLPGVSETTAQIVTNKALMKEVLCAQGVSTAEYRRVSSIEEARNACYNISYPVMFKCVDKSGSRGIIKVESDQEIDRAYEYAMSYTNLGYIIVERFIDGYEIGVDGFIGDDEMFIAPHDKIVFYNGDTNVPIGHSFPLKCSQSVMNDINSEVKKALKALKLKHTFFNMDIMIDKEGKSYIIEVGARCGATCIPELISLHYDTDYYKNMVLNALGIKFEIPEHCKRACAGELLLSHKSGRIKQIKHSLDLCDGISEVKFDYAVGDSVNNFRVGPDRIGHIIVYGDSREDALHNLQYAKNNILIDVEDELYI